MHPASDSQASETPLASATRASCSGSWRLSLRRSTAPAIGALSRRSAWPGWERRDDHPALKRRMHPCPPPSAVTPSDPALSC
eukprot:scaffold3752_cov117-Isochrysis_galbana.AAC.5